MAGHESPVFAGDTDAATVGAIGEHDEAMTIGAEPGIECLLCARRTHEDIFA